MKKVSFLLFILPLFLFSQEEFPDYPNGTGFSLEYLHPEYGGSDSAVLWVPADEFFGVYGFQDVFYVEREKENNGGGMHQSWNISRLIWNEEGFLNNDGENAFSHEWSVHYDTTFWDIDKFVKALPGLEEPRGVNGEFYMFDHNGFLQEWGFAGYGSGNQQYLKSYKYDEGYYLYVYTTDKIQAEEENLTAYWFLNPSGLPVKKVSFDDQGETLVREYFYEKEENFVGYKGEEPFLDQVKSKTRDFSSRAYQLYANGKHFEVAVQDKLGYHPDHILLGIWRFGYAHFVYYPQQKKYMLSEIIPFF